MASSAADGATWLWWSSGKDSAWALHVLRERGVRVTGLVTTLVESSGRVAVHDVRRELLERQAAAVGLPIDVVPLPRPCPNERYERAVAGVVERAAAAGVDTMAFGDLFLEDIRDYRVGLLEGTGMAPDFPIWNPDTEATAKAMCDAGLRAVLTCVDAARLPADFVGRTWDADLVAALPPDVDPCGENGEFHTFAWAGPVFAEPLAIDVVGTETRDGFAYADVALRA